MSKQGRESPSISQAAMDGLVDGFISFFNPLLGAK